MHADIEIHNAAKLNAPHLRRDAGTGARSALSNELGAMAASDALGFMREKVFSHRWAQIKHRFQKI